MKGNATCHTTSKKYREGWDRVFEKPVESDPEAVRAYIQAGGTWPPEDLE